jgi:hypothetical protein
MTGDGVNEVISQPAPASCIQVPMFEQTEAIHRARKSLWRSGLHTDAPGMADAGVSAASETIRVKSIGAFMPL